jgi:hypothetical protein
MKTRLIKQLAAYSGAAGAFVAFSGKADAQVVFTDLNPDITLLTANFDSYTIDFNNDATHEFSIETIFSASTYVTSGGSTFTYSNNMIAIYRNDPGFGMMGPFIVDALSLNDPISPAGSFSAYDFYANIGANYPGYYGYFAGQGDKYIGVHFSVGVNTHYGWILVNVAADLSSITIKSFAYELQTNTAILAGDMGLVGIDAKEYPEFQIVPSPAQDIIQLSAPAGGNISFMDISGKIVHSSAVEKGTHTINISHLTQGMYFVKFLSDDGVAEMRKLVVKK